MNRLAPIIAASVILMFLPRCKKAEEAVSITPRSVVSLVIGDFESEIKRSFSGQVKNAEGAPLAFESEGRITKVVAKEGVRYEAGDILAEVDETTYRSSYLGAEAELVNARQELRRTQQLFETNNASQASLESAVASEAAARSSFEQAKKALNDVVLKMPYDGVIGKVDLEAQQVVSAGQQIMTIQGESGKEFEVGVTPDFIADLEVGLSGKLRLGAISEAEFDVLISEISPEANENATYSVTFELVDESKDDSTIRSGMDGEVDLSLPNPEGDVLRVPIEAIAANTDGEPFVWIVTPIEGKMGVASVSKRTVATAAMAAGGKIEVVKGLDAGERIVIRGVSSLDEMMTVTLLD